MIAFYSAMLRIACGYPVVSSYATMNGACWRHKHESNLAGNVHRKELIRRKLGKTIAHLGARPSAANGLRCVVAAFGLFGGRH